MDYIRINIKNNTMKLTPLTKELAGKKYCRYHIQHFNKNIDQAINTLQNLFNVWSDVSAEYKYPLGKIEFSGINR